MLGKTIESVDLDGNPIKKTYWFNLTESEVIKMELATHVGEDTRGLKYQIEQIIASNNGKEIMETFEKLILNAYGERSADNVRFIKSRELSEAFSQTDAYNQLFVELVTDANSSAEFVRGVLPAKLQDHLPKQAPFEVGVQDVPIPDTFQNNADMGLPATSLVDTRQMTDEQIIQYMRNR